MLLKNQIISLADYYGKMFLEFDSDYKCELIQLLSIEKEDFI